MAVVNTKSSRVTNADSSTQTLDKIGVNQGRVHRQVATVETVSGDSIASTYRMLRVHSSWSIVSIKIFCDAITSAAADVGLYNIASRSSGAVVDADAYGSAVSLDTASTTGIEVAYEARDIANCERQVWQDAGATTDPGYWYDLALTLTAAAAAAGTISIELAYVGND